MGDYQISFTPDSGDVPTTSAIYLSLRNGFLASIEASKGTVANGAYGYLRDAIIQQSVSAGGYIENLDENFPNDIVEGVKGDSGENQFRHHMFKFGENCITIHLTLLLNYDGNDVGVMRQLLTSIKLNYKEEIPGEIGEYLQIIVDPNHNLSKIGTEGVVNL
ncbi:MAG: hypothetical protein F2961_00195 [Actinobacteria bacterium]|nr:hypothetical protein [Actinomycetota bacterium]MTA57339.1 hypothetical protein [Actinomycetota bacterium]